MRENFDLANRLTLAKGIEGITFSNRKNDLGGPTAAGITLNTLKDAFEDFDYGDFDEDGDIDIDDLLMLDTPEEAAPIYKRLFWNKIKGDELPSKLDYLVYDGAVNHGPANSGRFLQRAINRVRQMKLKEDGSIGRLTLAAISYRDTPSLIADIFRERDIFYRKIVAVNPKQIENFNGWMNRLKLVRINLEKFPT